MINPLFMFCSNNVQKENPSPLAGLCPCFLTFILNWIQGICPPDFSGVSELRQVALDWSEADYSQAKRD